MKRRFEPSRMTRPEPPRMTLYVFAGSSFFVPAFVTFVNFGADVCCSSTRMTSFVSVRPSSVPWK